MRKNSQIVVAGQHTSPEQTKARSLREERPAEVSDHVRDRRRVTIGAQVDVETQQEDANALAQHKTGGNPNGATKTGGRELAGALGWSSAAMTTSLARPLPPASSGYVRSLRRRAKVRATRSSSPEEQPDTMQRR